MICRNTTSPGSTPHPNSAINEASNVATTSNASVSVTITDPTTGNIQISRIVAQYDNGIVSPTPITVTQGAGVATNIQPINGTGPYDIALNPFPGGSGNVVVVLPAGGTSRFGALSVEYQVTN